jgi:hypothetical protein
MRLFLSILFLSFVVSGFAQNNDTTKYNIVNGYGYQWKAGKFDSTLIIPRGDTVYGFLGALRYRNNDGFIYYNNGAAWIKVSSGSGVDTFTIATKGYARYRSDSIYYANPNNYLTPSYAPTLQQVATNGSTYTGQLTTQGYNTTNRYLHLAEDSVLMAAKYNVLGSLTRDFIKIDSAGDAITISAYNLTLNTRGNALTIPGLISSYGYFQGTVSSGLFLQNDWGGGYYTQIGVRGSSSANKWYIPTGSGTFADSATVAGIISGSTNIANAKNADSLGHNSIPQLKSTMLNNIYDSANIYQVTVNNLYVLGNSIAASGRANPSYLAYYNQLALLTNRKVVNYAIGGTGISRFGIVGSTSYDSAGIARLWTIPAYNAGDIYTILYSVNEIRNAVDTAQFRSDYSNFLDSMLRKGWPAKQIYVSTTTWWNDSITRVPYQQQYITIDSSVCAQRGINWVNPRAKMIAYNAYGNGLLDDSLHPNTLGHQFILNAFLEKLQINSVKTGTNNWINGTNVSNANYVYGTLNSALTTPPSAIFMDSLTNHQKPTMVQLSSTNTHSAGYDFYRARNSLHSQVAGILNAAVKSGDYIMELKAFAHDGSTYQNSATLRAIMEADASSGSAQVGFGILTGTSNASKQYGFYQFANRKVYVGSTASVPTDNTIGALQVAGALTATGNAYIAGQTSNNAFINLPVSTSTTASIYFPSGGAPSSLVDGQFWRTTSGFKYYNGSATRRFVTAGDAAPTSTQYLLGNGTDFTVTSITSTPTASTLAAWDANKNLSDNNIIHGYTTTATAGATTALTAASTYLQFFTGTLNQTVTLPSNAAQGMQFYIRNNSSGLITINASGGGLVRIVGAGTRAMVTCLNANGTAAADWSANYLGINITDGKVLSATNNLTLSGTDGSTLNVGSGGTLGSAAYVNVNNNFTNSRQDITSGTSSTVTTGVRRVYINLASLAATFTLTTATMNDGDMLELFFGGTITAGNPVVTTFTLTPASGSVYGGITLNTAKGGDYAAYVWDATNSLLRRVK